MADEQQQSSQKDAYACEQEHSFSIMESRMPESFEAEAIRVCLAAVDRFKQLKDMAKFIKQEYDKLHVGSGKATEGVYHCVVGKSFATALSHETRQFLHLRVDTYHIILWKSKDSPFHMSDS